MKILLLSYFMPFIMFSKNKFTMFMVIMSSMMMILLNSNNSLYNNMFYIDMLSTIMLSLSMISVILIIMSSMNINNITLTILPILLILMMTFMSTNMLMFYILFELVLIPTLILITTQGKQSERLQAGIYMIVYTVMASLPLLISILNLKINSSFLLCSTSMIIISIPLFSMLAFLAKMPMYFIHLWLPKAHVEAPLEGSMILAAILLKLGGYGLIRFMPLFIKMITSINYWIISISLMGGFATSLQCTRQKDLKSLIAYSSVAHMGLVLMGIFSINSIGMNGAIIMMIAHGLTSSALFLLVNDLYMKYHSRNIMLFKGLLIMSPNISFWWFMFMAMNISAPPSINTASEIMLLTSMINWNFMTMPLIFMMSLATTSFSMMMFITIYHNHNFMMPTNQTPQKIFLSLFSHMIPLILLIMKMEIMY